MTEPPRSDLTVDRVIEAFGVMGRYLRERGLVGEIAVYGRTAILLQFRWGSPTEDVDVVIRTGERESVVKDAAIFAALALGLPDDWLNTYVGAFTAEKESESFFSAYGAYPKGRRIRAASRGNRALWSGSTNVKIMRERNAGGLSAMSVPRRAIESGTNAGRDSR